MREYVHVQVQQDTTVYTNTPVRNVQGPAMHTVVIQEYRFQITRAYRDDTQNDPKCSFNFGLGPAWLFLCSAAPEFFRVPFNFFFASMRERHDLSADGQAIAQGA